MELDQFRKIVWDYYHMHGRRLPWRETTDPYAILVSEMMLQQTQVSRVIPKYKAFLEELPTLAVLASAPLPLVLDLWSGLGYNRRAKYLHDAAKILINASLPWQPADLMACKGIGPNTAAAVCVYAFNQPHVFIETNIRSVFIHHFFPTHNPKDLGSVARSDLAKVSDHELVPFIEQTLDRRNPREFYGALMDYGSHLKKTTPNPSRASHHYSRQSVFAGSRRQLRGKVLKLLLGSQPTSRADLAEALNDERLSGVLDDLHSEGLITTHMRHIRLAS